jgi:hypothetical protein
MRLDLRVDGQYAIDEIRTNTGELLFASDLRDHKDELVYVWDEGRRLE